MQDTTPDQEQRAGLVSGAFYMTKPDITKMTTLSASTIDRLEADGQFPARIPLGDKKVVWRASDILEWCELTSGGKGYPEKGFYSENKQGIP